MTSARLQRRDMQTGFEFIHLKKTLYVVVEKYNRQRGTVIVKNPATGYQSEISFSIIRKNGRKNVSQNSPRRVARNDEGIQTALLGFAAGEMAR